MARALLVRSGGVKHYLPGKIRGENQKENQRREENQGRTTFYQLGNTHCQRSGAVRPLKRGLSLFFALFRSLFFGRSGRGCRR